MAEESYEHLGLRLPDRFGVYLRWPENGNDWIHPDDLDLTLSLIPSGRIFQRHLYDRDYNLLVYGQSQIRVRPTLWLEVKTDGYLIGDRVEIRSQMGKRSPAIATIEEIMFNHRTGAIEYTLAINGNRQSSVFSFGDIQPAFKLGEPLDDRQRSLIERARIS